MKFTANFLMKFIMKSVMKSPMNFRNERLLTGNGNPLGKILIQTSLCEKI